MAIVAAFWCATNTTVYPEPWFGEPLALKFGISPYWIDTVEVSESTALAGHTTRAALTNVHYYFGFFFLLLFSLSYTTALVKIFFVNSFANSFDLSVTLQLFCIEQFL